MPIKPIGSSENESTVHATKATGMSECYLHCCGSCNIWYVIEITAGIGNLLINGRGDDLPIYDQCSHDGLNGTGSPLCMTDHRFGGADGNVIGLLSKNCFVCCCFSRLIVGSRTAMRI